jgi:hypothetical protein
MAPKAKSVKSKRSGKSGGPRISVGESDAAELNLASVRLTSERGKLVVALATEPLQGVGKLLCSDPWPAHIKEKDLPAASKLRYPCGRQSSLVACKRFRIAAGSSSGRVGSLVSRFRGMPVVQHQEHGGRSNRDGAPRSVGVQGWVGRMLLHLRQGLQFPMGQEILQHSQVPKRMCEGHRPLAVPPVQEGLVRSAEACWPCTWLCAARFLEIKRAFCFLGRLLKSILCLCVRKINTGGSLLGIRSFPTCCKSEHFSLNGRPLDEWAVFVFTRGVKKKILS